MPRMRRPGDGGSGAGPDLPDRAHVGPGRERRAEPVFANRAAFGSGSSVAKEESSGVTAKAQECGGLGCGCTQCPGGVRSGTRGVHQVEVDDVGCTQCPGGVRSGTKLDGKTATMKDFAAPNVQAGGGLEHACTRTAQSDTSAAA